MNKIKTLFQNKWFVGAIIVVLVPLILSSQFLFIVVLVLGGVWFFRKYGGSLFVGMRTSQRNAERKAMEKNLGRIKIKCPLCRDIIPADALRCSHCAGDLTEASIKAKIDEQIVSIQKRNKVIVGSILVFVAFGFGSMFFGNSDAQPQSTPSQSRVTTLNVGQQGVLHMTDDPGQIIFIATTESAFDELSKVLIAKDTVGVLELAGQGKVFGVTNGSKVLIVDRSFVKRKVRILEGIRPIDSDKIGLAGWVPVEWVVVGK